MIRFEWNENKNIENQRKHGISFQEAAFVFYDSFALLFDDPDHSDEEERYVMIGRSVNLTICVVCHCYRDSVIRIISARKATKSEKEFFIKEMRRELT